MLVRLLHSSYASGLAKETMLLFQMRCMPCILLYPGLISPFVNLWDFSRTIRKDRRNKQIATLRRESFFFRVSLARRELPPEAKSKKGETIRFLPNTSFKTIAPEQ
jgi:hypothetical protein